MTDLSSSLNILDYLSLIVFIGCWFLFEIAADYSRFSDQSLSGLMAKKRIQWMEMLANRELRMIDTQIMSGLQQGAAFFASTSILAIGGCFALLGSTDIVFQIYQDLPLSKEFSRGVWEAKVLGLALIFAYTFFKFGWSYRVFNYCSVLLGAVPAPNEGDKETRDKEALRVAKMNIIGGRHFTAGLRGIFFAVGYMGWFIGPRFFIVSTVLVLLVLIRRQFFSNARKVLL